MGLPDAVKFPPAVEAARDARCHLWVERVDFDNAVSDEGIAAAVGRMKAQVIGRAEAADQRINLVRILQFEGRVTEQCSDVGECSGEPRGGLHRQPLIDHQRFVSPFRVERIECILAFCAFGVRQQR